MPSSREQRACSCRGRRSRRRTASKKLRSDGVPDRVDHERAEQHQRGQQEQRRHGLAGAGHALARGAGRAERAGRRLPARRATSSPVSRQLLYALAASASSFAWVPATSFGFFRKSWRSFHSPLPWRAAERLRGLVGHVEAEVVARRDQRLGDAALHRRSGTPAVSSVLVRRDEAARLGPDLRRVRSRPGRSAAPAAPLPSFSATAASPPRDHRGLGADRREREHLGVRADLRLGLAAMLTPTKSPS